MKRDQRSDVRGRPRSRRWRRWVHRGCKVAAAVLVVLVVLWIAILRVSWLGPALADGARAIVGPRPVAWVEDVAYGIQDRINRWRYRNAKPLAFWPPPPRLPPALPDSAPDDGPRFRLRPFEPPHATVATPADGVWLPVVEPEWPAAPVAAYKTMVHPDPRRGFAALAVVAIDVHAFDLHLVAGTREPQSMRVRSEDRPGVIPPGDDATLFAAFNGGFKAVHGQYGMMLEGVEYLPPRSIACTFASYRDGRLRIGTWSVLASDVARMRYYRQTPPCLVEEGKVHRALHYREYAKGWGATVSGETVIRRSALGLREDGAVLYYGLGEAMTARALAEGMQAAGAHTTAELDVNHSYPRFLFFRRPGPGQKPEAVSALIPGIEYPPDQYVVRPSVRDFFYLTRRSRRAAAPRGGGGKLATAGR